MQTVRNIYTFLKHSQNHKFKCITLILTSNSHNHKITTILHKDLNSMTLWMTPIANS